MWSLFSILVVDTRVLRLSQMGKALLFVFLQFQKPACPWEFYIYRQLDMRVSNEDVSD